jgi:Carboxypeptidase regulatory-like domain/TonB dependent receptor
MKTMQSLGLGLCLMALVALLLGGPAARAQDVTATITGTVMDQSGAAVVGATVTARSVERGTTFKDVTNEQGIYRITQLPVGNYELTVEKQGFQTAKYPAFTLVLNQIARIDPQLTVGQVSQTVEVSGSAPLLKTEATLVDTIIDSKTNDELPLATRNYVELTLLSPGAVHPDPSSFNNGDNVNSGARPFINGNREQANNFLLDGMDNNEVSDNLLGYTPAPDAIQEFNLITNNAPAEFGNFMGGIVSVTLKSGTNSYHGDTWEFFRNDVLNANQWENKINPNSPEIPRAPLRWNMFGGTLGGPIIKNKLFFFVDYQGQRFDHPPAGQFISAFTPAEQSGDFSALCTNGFVGGICQDRVSSASTPTGYTCGVGDNTNGCVVANQLYNPCAAGTGVSGSPCTASAAANAMRPAFGNNQIPLSMISPVAAALFASSFYPKTVNSNLTNNAINQVSSAYNSDQGDFKIDYRLSSKDMISGRFTRALQIDPSTNSIELLGNSQVQAPIWSFVTDWTHTISNNLINDARFGWNHIVLDTGATWDPAVGAFGQSIGIANSNPSGLGVGLLNLAFGGGTPTSPDCGTISCIGNSMVTQNFNSKVWQVDDAITWVRGRHTFKFGGEYMFDSITVFYSGNSGELGGMTFGANYTASSAVCTDAANCNATSPFAGNGMGDFFLGLPTSFGRGLDGGNWEQTTNIISGFGQDTWRVSNNLTLTLGLRYEAHTPWVEVNNQQTNFNPITGEIEYAGQDGASRALYNGVYGGKDFQPRLGFAWTPGGRFGEKTVLRGAFTISDYLEGTGTNLRLPLNPPYDGGATAGGEFQTQYLNEALPTTTASDGIIAPPPAGLSCPNLSCFSGAVLRMWDQNVQPAVDDEWNLTVQHQFSNTTTFQVGYVGQVAYHLMVPFYYGQPVAEPATSCSTPPCTSPSPFFANGEGPALISEILSTGGTVSGTQSNGRMMYNALQAVLHKNEGHGLEYQVAYTYSKCMSNNTGYYGTWTTARASSTASPYWQNIYDPAAEWAPCYYDETHNLTSYAVYDLPIGQGKQFGGNMSKALDTVVGGWTVSPILTLHTGFPLALYNNGVDQTGTGSRGLRPDCNGTNTVWGRRDATAAQGGGFAWFDPSNYTNAVGFGTCAPQLSGLLGPGFYNWDASLQKNFQLTERFRLQFRTDFLNMFNRVNLAVPNTTVETSTTGVIQASQPARNIQFALKLYF